MLPRTHLSQMQRSLYERLKKYARQFLGGLGPELKKYYQEYQRDLRKFEAISTKRELTAEIHKAQVVFCGDYHTLAQAQRTVVRLLREVVPTQNEIVLALEMLTPEATRSTERYLSGKLSERGFLKAIAFHQRWGFRWMNYHKLFEFAGQHGLKVRGINAPERRAGMTLAKRDAYAAEQLVALCRAHPDAQIFVLIGDLHLSRGHLPRAFSQAARAAGMKPRVVVIHQNVEHFYWALADRGLEQTVEVLKVRSGTYCVMNTPPWVKLQSHVKWAEGVVAAKGGGDFSDLTHAVHEGHDYSDDVHELGLYLQAFLELEDRWAADFILCIPRDGQSLDKALGLGREIPARRRALVARYGEEFKSFYLYSHQAVVLKTLSLNHLAALTMQHLHHKMSGFDRVFENPNRDFYPFIWVEAIAFLGSKIINHKRKCNGPEDLKKILVKLPSAARGNRRAVELALGVLEQEARRFSGSRASVALTKVLPRGACGAEAVLECFKATKILGKILGHALYAGLLKNEVSREDIRALLKFPLGSSKESEALYFSWIDVLDSLRLRDFQKTKHL